jgi:hypothetical protein
MYCVVIRAFLVTECNCEKETRQFHDAMPSTTPGWYISLNMQRAAFTRNKHGTVTSDQFHILVSTVHTVQYMKASKADAQEAKYI